MDKIVGAVGIGVIALLVIVGVSVLMAYPIMWVVNYLFTGATLTSLFGAAQLTVWKAFWLNFLCGWLFKGSTTVKEK